MASAETEVRPTPEQLQAKGYTRVEAPAGQPKPPSPQELQAKGYTRVQRPATHSQGYEAGISGEAFGFEKGRSFYGPQLMEPGYDYSTGVDDTKVHFDLSRADNQDEQRKVLEKKFGSHVFQDKFGNWMVKPEGFGSAGMETHGSVP